MRRPTKHQPLAALFLALALLGAASAALAQTGGGYDLSWSTIDGGGGASSGGGYEVSGTIGQPDAGTMTGGSYTLAGGFWGSVGVTIYHIYLPVILRNF